MPDLPLIMLIRHAEKADGANETGVHSNGEDDAHSLSVQGWQRAGALVPLFVPAGRPRLDSRLPQPATLIAEFAGAPGSEAKKSKREEQTLQPLANRLGLKPDFSFGKGQEPEAAAAARKASGPVLIAWEHGNIFHLAAQLTADPLPIEVAQGPLRHRPPLHPQRRRRLLPPAGPAAPPRRRHRHAHRLAANPAAF